MLPALCSISRKVPIKPGSRRYKPENFESMTNSNNAMTYVKNHRKTNTSGP
jgi:hypothetical protein